MEFKEFWNKLTSSKSAKELKELAELTEDQLESLGRKILQKSKFAGEKTMDFVDTEGSKLFKKAKEKLEDFKVHHSSFEIDDFFKSDKEDKIDLDDILGSEFDESYSATEKTEGSKNTSKDKKGDFIDRILKKVEHNLDSVEDIISDKTNLEALKESDLIPDHFIAKARKFADTSLSKMDSVKKKVIDKTKDIAGFEDHDGDGDPLIDDAIIDED